MDWSGLAFDIFRGALRDIAQKQKRQERIEELDGGEEEYEARQSLKELPGVGEKTAGRLYRAGYEDASEAVSAPMDELLEIKGIGEKKAEKIKRYTNSSADFTVKIQDFGDLP